MRCPWLDSWSLRCSDMPAPILTPHHTWPPEPLGIICRFFFQNESQAPIQPWILHYHRMQLMRGNACILIILLHLVHGSNFYSAKRSLGGECLSYLGFCSRACPAGFLAHLPLSPSEDARDIDGAPAEAADGHVVALIMPSLEDSPIVPLLYIRSSPRDALSFGRAQTDASDLHRRQGF